MKNIFYKTLFIIVGINLLLSNCVTTDINSEDADNTEATNNIEDETKYSTLRFEVETLISNRKLREAKNILYDAMEALGEHKQTPYIENNTLYIYAESDDTFVILLMFEISDDFFSTPEILELRKNLSYNKIVLLDPIYPYIYYQLAYIAAEEGQANDAMDNLLKALDIWPDFTIAYAELIYVYMMTGNHSTAKAIAEEALNRDLCTINPIGTASIYRKLGYIAIEENQLDLAEQYYNKSLELDPDNEVALAELEYIRTLR